MVDFCNEYLQKDGKKNIQLMLRSVCYWIQKWFDESKDTEFKRLNRENVGDYISFLKMVTDFNLKSIRTTGNALVKFNGFFMSRKFRMT